MPSHEIYPDSDEYNILYHTTSPQVFTEIEDNIVELMGGPLKSTTSLTNHEDSCDEIETNFYNKDIELCDALTGFDFMKKGNELTFTFNKHFSARKRINNKKQEKPVANYDNLDKILQRLGTNKIDFDYGDDVQAVVLVKREKRVCGNWENENRDRVVKNGPKIIKRFRNKKG